MVTPSQAMGTIERLRADIYMNNQWLRTIELDDPSTDSSSLIKLILMSVRVCNIVSARGVLDSIRSLNTSEVCVFSSKILMDIRDKLPEDKIDFASPGAGLK